MGEKSGNCGNKMLAIFASVFLLSVFASQVESQYYPPAGGVTDPPEDTSGKTSECRGTSYTYGVGELVFVWGKDNCTNVEVVTGWYGSCSGRCESSSKLLVESTGRSRK